MNGKHHTRRRGGRFAAVLALALVTGGCTALDNALAAIPIFSFLRESPALDPYEAPRPAPANAVPFASPLGVAPEPEIPPTDAGLRAFAETVSNPVPMSEEVIAAGQVLFHRHCYVCHGATGEGNGPATGQGRFPFAPSLVTDRVEGLPDGYIYGIIRVGRGLMPAYGGRIPNYHERWYIVNYVRYLQQQGGAPAQSAAQGATSGGE